MSSIDRDVFLYGMLASDRLQNSQEVDPSLHLHTVHDTAKLFTALENARDPVVVLGGSTGDEPSFTLLRDLAARFSSIELIVVLRQPWVDVAVEAIKGGASDVWMGPLTAAHLERLVKEHAHADADADADADVRVVYGLDRARHLIAASRLEEAERSLRAALPHMQKLPAVFNLLGVIRERHGQVHSAQAFYRAALNFQGDYQPALSNLERTSRRPNLTPPWLGDPETDA